MTTSGTFNPWNYEYCSNSGGDGYCSIIPFCIADGETKTSEPCSCAGDKVLSTCYSGETCNKDGECCSGADISCSTGMAYIPESYLFTSCEHFLWLSTTVCEYTDGLTSNIDESGCCCVDQNVGVYDNSDFCLMPYSYCNNGGTDAYCSITKFCPIDTAATEICSCAGDKLLSTCSVGESCDSDGKCCDSNGICKTGSVDEMYYFPVDDMICKHTDGSTSDGKECECGKYMWCMEDEFCFLTSSIDTPSLCLHKRICPVNDGTMVYAGGCACVTRREGGSYCNSEEYCHDTTCFDLPRCRAVNGRVSTAVSCQCGDLSCEVGEFCHLLKVDAPLCLDAKMCKANDGGRLSVAPSDGCTCFVYGRAQHCTHGAYCHSNGCRLFSRTVEILTYAILALVIVCLVILGVYLFRRYRVPNQNRPEGVELRPVRVEPGVQGVQAVGTAGIPGEGDYPRAY